jgi:REP element-mobilizing transposase RayT
MTKNFKSSESGIPYFLTFTVVEWLNVFTQTSYLKILWDSLQYCRKEKGMKLYGFVFMTNHLHLIISADYKNIKLWEIIRDFKKFTAQKIIQIMQKEENRRWILDVMKAAGTKNNANTQY